MVIRFPSALDNLMSYVEKPEAPASQPKPMKKERSAATAEVLATPVKVANKADTDVANIANAPDPSVANKYGRYADKEKRRIYMREYMKTKRAAQKENHGSS
jgi:hypothetical protein